MARLKNTLRNPHKILSDVKDPNVGIVVKILNKKQQQKYHIVVVKLKLPSNPKNYSNSILTSFIIGEESWKRFKKKRKILYEKGKKSDNKIKK